MSCLKNDACCKNEAGCDDTTNTGIVSINGDTTQAQLIVGSGVTVSTTGGTTTITGGAAGSITGMTAPQMFVSPVPISGTTLQLQYANVPINITASGNSSQTDTRTNANAGSSAESGYTAINDSSNSISMVMPSSTGSNIGTIRTSTLAFGTDIVQEGVGKKIRLMTNTVNPIITAQDSGAVINNLTTAGVVLNDATGLLSTTGGPLPIATGGTNAITKTAAFDNLAPSIVKGSLIVADGTNNITLPVGSNTQVLTADSTQTSGLKWAASSGSGVTSVDMTVPSLLSVSGNPITTSGTLAVSYSGTPLPILNGGTGQTTASAAFNVLAPSTAKGGLITGSGSNTYSNLPSGTNGYILVSNSAATNGVDWESPASALNSVVAFQATTTSAQSITTSTDTKVTWSTINLDSNTGWSAANNWYVVPNTGYYTVSAALAFSAGFSEYDSIVKVVKNNTTTILAGEIYHPAISALGNPVVTGVVSLSSGDTIQINVNQNSGSSITLNASAAITNFTINSVGGVSGGSGGSGTVTSVNTTSTAAALTLTGGPITASGTVTLGYSGTAIPIANGGTSATTKTAAFDALSPMTTGGDLIVGGSSGTGTRLANGTIGQMLTSAGTTLAPVWTTPAAGGTVISVNASVPAFMSISGNPITTSGTLTFGLSGTALPLTSGGTGGTTNTVGFNNLSPLNTSLKGDLITTNGSNNIRLGVGANGLFLAADSSQSGGLIWTSPSFTPTISNNVNSSVALTVSNINAGSSANASFVWINDNHSATINLNSSTYTTEKNDFVITNNISTAGPAGDIYINEVDSTGNIILQIANTDKLTLNTTNTTLHTNLVLDSGKNVTLNAGQINLTNTSHIVLTGTSDLSLASGSLLALLSGSSIVVFSGSQITINGGALLEIINGGTLRIDSGGILSVSGTQTIQSLGVLNIATNGLQTVQSGGILNIASSGLQTVQAGGVLGIDGTFRIKSGGIGTIQSGGNLNTASGGIQTIQSGGSLVINSGGALKDSATSAGTNKQILTSNGTSPLWASSIEITAGNSILMDSTSFIDFSPGGKIKDSTGSFGAFGQFLTSTG